MDAFRKRASTLLSSTRLYADNSREDRTPSPSPTAEKGALQEKATEHPETPGSGNTGSEVQSISVGGTEQPWPTTSHNAVRYLPPWIQDACQDDEDEDDPTPASNLLPQEPSATQVAQHNHTPSAIHPSGFLAWHKIEPGRKYDGQRRSEPPTSRHHPREIASRWREFAHASEYPRSENEPRHVVDEEYLVNHEPDFFSDWHEEHHEPNIHTYRPRRQTAWMRMQRTVLRSAFIPLVFRLLVLTFSVMALGLGVTIYQSFNAASYHEGFLSSNCRMDYETSTISPLMAIVVGSAAVFYIFGITWDEYRGLPLGLRSGKAKILILLFDLFFIVFSSANVTLAFEGVRGFGVGCQGVNSIDQIKWKQEFLASVLLAALVSWLMTFAVSVLRFVIFQFLFVSNRAAEWWRNLNIDDRT